MPAIVTVCISSINISFRVSMRISRCQIPVEALCLICHHDFSIGAGRAFLGVNQEASVRVRRFHSCSTWIAWQEGSCSLESSGTQSFLWSCVLGWRVGPARATAEIISDFRVKAQTPRTHRYWKMILSIQPSRKDERRVAWPTTTEWRRRSRLLLRLF